MNDISRRVLTPPPTEPGDTPRPRHFRTGPFGVLDLGSTQIACLIGRTESDGTLRVLGVGWHRGRGVRGGGIVDLEEAERAIRAKIADSFAAGTRVVRDVDALHSREERVYRATQPDHPTVYGMADEAEAEPAVPGWRVRVRSLLE